MTTIEMTLMRALNLKSVEELDELLARPISEDVAEHSKLPDEEYRLADLMYAEADRQWDARKRFDTLEGKYIN
jgi:hypothetical protein